MGRCADRDRKRTSRPWSYTHERPDLSNRHPTPLLSARLIPMNTDEKPKSAIELAMERLRRRDADGGIAERQVTEAQKAAIAEARSVHASKVAELEILHRSKVVDVLDPAVRALVEDEYRRELQRLNDGLERKVEKIRSE